LNKYGAKVVEEICDKDIACEIRINSWYLEEFKKELFENSKGQIII
jgi:hypothetical protein